MARDSDELYKMTKPNGDHVCNGSGTIKGLADSFDS